MIGLAILFGIVLGVMLLAFEDGISMGLLKRILCRVGWHKIHNKIGQLKIHKYYCQRCKTPRKHPQLTAIDGGNKAIRASSSSFKF